VLGCIFGCQNLRVLLEGGSGGSDGSGERGSVDYSLGVVDRRGGENTLQHKKTS